MSQQAFLLAQEIQGYFETSGYWEYEKLLGSGSYGLAVLLRQKGEHGSHRHRMAVKVALASSAQQLRSEISWLKRLHGAKHIVQILASCDNLVQPDRELPPKLQHAPPMIGFIDQTAFSSLAGIQGPVLALEYLENGDMLSLFKRMFNDDVRLPNRMLWSLYLCLIRACIGMAYPISRPIGTQSILETIPNDSTPPQGITHNDIAPRNIMLGIEDELDEHHQGNIFKLIDFGEARTTADPNMGPSENLRAISAYVAFFINMADISQRQVVDYKGFGTTAGQLLPQSWGEPYPWLDPDLAGLIAQCMYIDWKKRPTLQQALERASDAVLSKSPYSFPEPEEETDDAIIEFVQEYVLDRLTIVAWAN
ncbi:kinase-like domain-containing protein [Xylaria castorea]|nr:kinase-like domain-containing protein [Xylaria castorea]